MKDSRGLEAEAFYEQELVAQAPRHHRPFKVS